MKAVVQVVYGNPEVLQLRDVTKPVAGDGGLLIRVRAAGVDRGVWHLMTGLPYLMRVVGYGLRRPKEPVRGREVAGVVEATGPGVERFRAGDEVFGTCEGSFAEYACAKETKVARKPRSLSFEEAAAVPVSGVTALQAVRDAAQVTVGQKVLILGAGGGVGSFAVQIAKAFGAEVTGVCSSGKAALVQSLGADAVIDYTKTDPAAAGVLYDVILDTAGNRPLPVLRRMLANRGTLVIVGGEGGGKLTGGIERSLAAAIVSLFSRQNLKGLITKENHEDLEALAAMIEAGSVKPVLDKVFALAETPDALRYLREGRTMGKVVITL